MDTQGKIERHIQGSISSGLLSEREAGLIHRFLDDMELEKEPSDDWLKNKYHLLFRSVQVIHTATGKELPDIKVPPRTEQAPGEERSTDLKNIVKVAKSADYSDNYRRQLISTTKELLVWMSDHAYADIDASSVRKVKLPSPQWKCKSAEDMLTRDQIFQGIEACRNPRDECLVAMLFDSSCRTIELLSLDWKDITFDDRGAKFSTNRKTGYKRTIRLTFSVPYLVKWRDNYRGVPEGDSPVFCHVNRKEGGSFPRMSKDNVDRLMKYIRTRTGISKFSPGIFRPSRISADVADGYELPYVMLKNWGNLKTGMIDRYTNLSEDYTDRQALEMSGIDVPISKEKRKDLGKLKPLVCPNCGTMNVPTAGYCNDCGRPLTPEVRVNQDEMMKLLTEWISKDPDGFIETLKMRQGEKLINSEGG